jgi:hypothetical protein
MGEGCPSFSVSYPTPTIDFPSLPFSGDTYGYAGKVWEWNEYGWKIVCAGSSGNEVVIGSSGGVTDINGASGGITLIGGDGINILTSSNIITVSTELYRLIDGGLY